MKKIQKDDEINSHDGERLLWLRESEKSVCEGGICTYAKKIRRSKLCQDLGKESSRQREQTKQVKTCRNENKLSCWRKR